MLLQQCKHIHIKSGNKQNRLTVIQFTKSQVIRKLRKIGIYEFSSSSFIYSNRINHNDLSGSGSVLLYKRGKTALRLACVRKLKKSENFTAVKEIQ